MKWTFVDSHGLDVVLKLLDNGWVIHALKKLQDGSCGLTQTSTRQRDFHSPGAASRQSESPKAIFSLHADIPAVSGSRWSVLFWPVAESTAFFTFSEEQ
jgi:hypothetical protein